LVIPVDCQLVVLPVATDQIQPPPQSRQVETKRRWLKDCRMASSNLDRERWVMRGESIANMMRISFDMMTNLGYQFPSPRMIFINFENGKLLK
jgi:hypothetical protein